MSMNTWVKDTGTDIRDVLFYFIAAFILFYFISFHLILLHFILLHTTSRHYVKYIQILIH